MRNRNILKLILLSCMFILSCIFIFSNRLLWLYNTNNLIYIYLFPILLPINIYLLKRKKKGLFIYLFSIVNGIFLAFEIINTIKGYLEFNGYMLEYFYLVIISYALISSILNFRRTENIYNDLLISLISFFIIVIHIRYYFDNSFLHNLLNITDTNSIILQNSYSYVTSCYGYFIIMFLVVLINQEIDSL